MVKGSVWQSEEAVTKSQLIKKVRGALGKKTLKNHGVTGKEKMDGGEEMAYIVARGE